MLGNPDSEERFVEGVDKPRALAIDEQQGYVVCDIRPSLTILFYAENYDLITDY